MNELLEILELTSICGLGMSAAKPLATVLQSFATGRAGVASGPRSNRHEHGIGWTSLDQPGRGRRARVFRPGKRKTSSPATSRGG